MRFLADMCMDVCVASWLNSQGHDATHLRETRDFSECPTVESSKKAVAESRVVVTFDLDFGEIVALSKGRKTGVILFRLRNTRTAFVIQRLSEVWLIRKFAAVFEKLRSRATQRKISN